MAAVESKMYLIFMNAISPSNHHFSRESALLYHRKPVLASPGDCPQQFSLWIRQYWSEILARIIRL